MILEKFLMGRRRADLSSDDLECLENAAEEPKIIEARTTFISAGTPVSRSTYLIEGFICRYMDDKSGGRQLVGIHVPGDFVDLHAYPLGYLDHDLATLTQCRVAMVPHENLDKILKERASLSKHLWFSTLLDAAQHRDWIFALGRLTAAARIARLMCEMDAKLRAVGLSDNGHFSLPITQPDLGEACGITAVHANRMLRDLRLNKLMTFRGGDVAIHNYDRLTKLAEFDPTYLYLDEMS